MLELMTEILVYLAIAALIGFLLGFLTWGWGRAAKIEAARAEGISAVRTSVDGDSSLKTQLAECEQQRKRLELSLDRSKDKIAALESELRSLDRAAIGSVPDQITEIENSEELAEEAHIADETDTLDADIEPVVDEPVAEPTRRSLFATDRDVDPRISGFDPDEEKLSEAEAEETAFREPEQPSISVQETEPEQTPIPEKEPTSRPVMSEPAPVPSSLLSERPQEVDDLKTIKGVGVVMEGVLNDKGVYLFHQIANFSPTDVDWVNEAIEAFPGRIERDDWVGQAQELYRAKYGRSHDERT